MALIDLKSKQSLVGLNNPISEYENFGAPTSEFSGFGSTGDAFANFRNVAYGFGPEPAPNILDTVSEKLLIQDYSYSGFANPYPTTMFGGTLTIPAGTKDLDGSTPTSYQDTPGAPSDGYY